MVAVGELARSRAEAKAEGKRFYFTAKPCKHGHISIRYVSGECVECVKICSKRWHEANPDKVRAKDAVWRASNPEKLRQKNSSPAKRAYNKRYVKANPDRVREHQARWRSKNQETTRFHASRRYATRKGATERCTREQLDELRKKAGDRCWACGRRGKLSVDHIIPLSKGGTDAIRNIQFLCRPCNSSKRNRDNEDFARSTGRLL